MATEMKRFTVSVPLDLENDLDELKKNKFYNSTKSEMIRYLLDMGLKAANLNSTSNMKEQPELQKVAI